MPTVNIYFQNLSDTAPLSGKVLELRTYLAEALSGSDITLSSAEVSIRFIKSHGGEMIAPVELEISAHAFAERVEKQDQICLEVMKWIKEKIGLDTKVWLRLSELGHSW